MSGAGKLNVTRAMCKGRRVAGFVLASVVAAGVATAAVASEAVPAAARLPSVRATLPLRTSSDATGRTSADGITLNVHVYLQVIDPSLKAGLPDVPAHNEGAPASSRLSEMNVEPDAAWSISLDNSSSAWMSSLSTIAPLSSPAFSRDVASSRDRGLVGLFTMVDERLYLALANSAVPATGFGASLLARPASPAHDNGPALAVRLAADDLPAPDEQAGSWRRLPVTLGHSLSLRAAIGFSRERVLAGASPV